MYPLGRLRRIYSNPESPMMNSKSESQLRDSKSCSDLEDPSTALVNYLKLEQKLSQDANNLLSPPPIIPPALLKKFATAKDPIKSYEQIFDQALKTSGIDGSNEDISNADIRIRQWLRGVDTSGPNNES